ncbi:MAG: hypothetical protein HY924_12630 [Elusimicrobia bacterium]|nr:hypothetical protein [Elusimicrobiota bacterium]
MGLEREAMAKVTPSGQDFVQFIQTVAAKVQLGVQVKGPDMVVVPWDFGEGRLQNTYIRPLGQTGAGHLIIGFFSPCMKIATGAELDLKAALEFLRKNARMPHGAWAIASVQGEEYLGVQDTQIAQTMQPEEFHASAVVVAKVADDYEKQAGKDVF